MANIEKQVVITARSQGFDTLKTDAQGAANAVNNLTEAEGDLHNAQKKTRQSLLDNGGAVGILNELTGGLASTFKDAFEATEAFGGGLKGLKGAIISTGIGALVVLLGLLIANWDEWNGLITGTTQALEENATAIDAVTLAQRRNNAELQYQIDLAEAQGKSDKEIYQFKLNKIAEEIIANQKLIELEQEKIRIQNESRNILGLMNGDQEKVAESQKKIEDLRIKNTELRNSALVLEADTDRKLAEERAKRAEKTDADAQKAIDKAAQVAEAQRKALEAARRERAKFEADLAKEVDDAISEATDKQTERQLSAQENEIRRVEEHFFRLIELAKQQGKDTTALEEEKANQINDINVEAARKKKEIDDKAAADKKKTDEELAASSKALRDAEIEGQLKAADAFAGLLSATSELAKEGSAEQKAIGVAAATVDTLVSAVSAFRGMVAAIPGPIGIAAGVAAAAAATLSGFATVKKILAVKVPGGGGGGSAPQGGVAAQPAAQFNIIGQSQENQLATTIAGRQGQPVRTYVVSTEVTTNQSLDRNIINNATFLG